MKKYSYIYFWLVIIIRPLGLSLLVMIFILTGILPTKGQSGPRNLPGDPVYLFAYFKDNGEDGLHLAYSRNGYAWNALKKDSSFLTPLVSKDKLMRDPCIIRGGDGLFHMVWTVSWADKGIGYATSRDLIHWSIQQFLPVMIHEPNARNCWAPEITYDNSTGIYMIYWATTITGKFPETASVKENGNNHRIYYTTTKDFKTYSKTSLLYDPGFSVIDATIIKTDNRFVMFLKDETPDPPQKNLKMAFSNSLTGPYLARGDGSGSKGGSASRPITGKYWAEGPTTLLKDKEVVVYFDKYTEHRFGAIRSSDWRNWTDVSDKISLPRGIRHGTIFTIRQEELGPLLKL
ncbi:glycoside hydrolase family 43 protein [Flavitalea flava]